MEGGYFRRTYESGDVVTPGMLPGRYKSSRPFGTAIYYLLTPGIFSAMHQLPTDEIYHFYYGDPVELLILHPDGKGEIRTLGNELDKGMRPQIVVPKNCWHGSRLISGGELCLMGTSMSPGYDDADYTHGIRTELVAAYPGFSKEIMELTHMS